MEGNMEGNKSFGTQMVTIKKITKSTLIKFSYIKLVKSENNVPLKFSVLVPTYIAIITG